MSTHRTLLPGYGLERGFRRSSTSLVFACALLLLASGCEPPLSVADQLPQASPAKQVSPSSSESPQIVSLYSCGSSNCHGRSTPIPTPEEGKPTGCCLRDEQTLWKNKDPHVHAFESLRSKLAEDIVLKLEGPDATQAANNTRCTNCHAPQLMLAEIDSTPPPLPSQLGSGAECLICHGVELDWVSKHPDWNPLDEQKAKEDLAYAKTGYVDLSTLPRRVSACVRCHVGAPGETGSPHPGLSTPRDVNHDLIAAGHPRLHFEYVAFYDVLGRHWDQTHVETEHRFFSWQLGQWESLKAKLLLLKYRLDSLSTNDPHAVWPEFAELSCFACHQPASIYVHIQQTPVLANKIQADFSSIWGNEYAELFPTLSQAMLPTMTNEPASSQIKELDAKLRELTILLGNERPPTPAQIQQLTNDALKLTEQIPLNQLVESLDKTAEKRVAAAFMRKALNELDERLPQDSLTWEQVLSRIQGISLATETLSDQSEAWQTVEADLTKIRSELDFPLDGQKRYQYNSPLAFRPNLPVIHSQIVEIKQQISPLLDSASL